MRLLASSAFFASLLLSVPKHSAAFVPSSSLHQRTTTTTTTTASTANHALPSSVSFDVPAWLVEASSKVDAGLASSPTAAYTSSASSAASFSTDAAAQQLAVLLTSPNINIDADLAATISTALATPWHVEAIAAFALGNAFLGWINAPDHQNNNNMEAPYEAGTTTYSPEKAAAFYQQRPLLVAKRILRLALLTGAFNAGLLFDWLVRGKLLGDQDYTALKQAEPQRAKKALRLCERLGPTFIKLGQALSIRTDLVPEAYALELRQLQDAVPPFDSTEAYQVIRQQLGVRDLKEVFSYLSEEPVASASIGQVYRGTLASNGKDVAVKVQRPGILAEIALDLHVLRILTPLQTIAQNAANGVATSQEDIDTAITLVDEWGRGFVAETDYLLEATNTINFEAAMRNRGLEAVCAPQVVKELVRDRLLVTEWVEGTRLDRDASSDVPRLCGVAINAYLTMLLDTGVLHCDPQ